MTARRVALLALLSSLGACRRRGPALPASAPSPHDAAAARAPEQPPEGSAAPPARDPWCWQPRPTAQARAFAPDGHVWALRDGAVYDESASARFVLPAAEMPCPRLGRWALSFGEGGSVFVVAEGRLYVRAPGHEFAVTPLCGDLGPAAASPWQAGGYGFVSNGRIAGEPSLLLTHDPEGRHGWYAVTALAPTLRAIVLDRNRSMLTLNGRGQLVVVDQVHTVAGEVLAARGEAFVGLSRTEEGALAWRDTGDTGRVLVWGTRLEGEFARVEAERPRGSGTLYAAALDLARFVAVTAEGVELSSDGGHRFVRVLHRRLAPTGAPTDASAGWIAPGEPAVAFRDGIARASCEGFPADAGLR